MKYIVLSVVVLAMLVAALIIARVRVPWRVTGIVGAILLVLTLVFDNLIIGTGIVAYNPDFISGIKLWFAPIEDFAYSVAAVIIVLLLWEREVSRAGDS